MSIRQAKIATSKAVNSRFIMSKASSVRLAEGNGHLTVSGVKTHSLYQRRKETD
jgi:hypothetical protein